MLLLVGLILVLISSLNADIDYAQQVLDSIEYDPEVVAVLESAGGEDSARVDIEIATEPEEITFTLASGIAQKKLKREGHHWREGGNVTRKLQERRDRSKGGRIRVGAAAVSTVPTTRSDPGVKRFLAVVDKEKSEAISNIIAQTRPPKVGAASVASDGSDGSGEGTSTEKESKELRRNSKKQAIRAMVKDVREEIPDVRVRPMGGAGGAVVLEATPEEIDALIGAGLIEADSVREDIPVTILRTEQDDVINASVARAMSFGTTNLTGMGMTICVVDTGIDYNHSDLGGPAASAAANSRFVASYDVYDDDNDIVDAHGHGTHVAGIVAGNGTVNGVAPEAKIVGVKATSDTGVGMLSDVIEGIDYCANNVSGVDVITISLGTSPNSEVGGCLVDQASDAVINDTVEQGILIVASSGNNNNMTTISYPACQDNVIAVGATYDKNYTSTFSYPLANNCQDVNPLVDDVACFTNRGADLDLLAPGVTITSTVPHTGHCPLNPAGLCHDSGYSSTAGTSQAAPAVAGALILLKQAREITTGLNVNRTEAIMYLNDSGESIASNGRDYGRINISAAVETIATQSAATVNFSVRMIGPGMTFVNETVPHALNVSEFFAIEVSGRAAHCTLQFQNQTSGMLNRSHPRNPFYVNVSGGGSSYYKPGFFVNQTTNATFTYAVNCVAADDATVFATNETSNLTFSVWSNSSIGNYDLIRAAGTPAANFSLELCGNYDGTTAATCENNTLNISCSWNEAIDSCRGSDPEGTTTCSSFCQQCTSSSTCGNSLAGCAWVNVTTTEGHCAPAYAARAGFDCRQDCGLCNTEHACNSIGGPYVGACRWREDPIMPSQGSCDRNMSGLVCDENCFYCGPSNCEVVGRSLGGGGCRYNSTVDVCTPINFSGEVCFNGVDDDNDGHTDCNDPICGSFPGCGGRIATELGLIEYNNLVTRMSSVGSSFNFSLNASDGRELLMGYLVDQSAIGTTASLLNASFETVESGDAANSSFDITRVFAKESEYGLLFGAGPIGANLSLCSTSASQQQMHTRLDIYVDEDNTSTTGCQLAYNTTDSGYEFKIGAVVTGVAPYGNYSATLERCDTATSRWIPYPARVVLIKPLTCGNITGLGGKYVTIGISNADIKAPVIGERQRIHVALYANSSASTTAPSDSLGDILYAPGSAERSSPDCEDDPTLCGPFGTTGGGLFSPFEECSDWTSDEDQDGLLNCDDPDCFGSIRCVGDQPSVTGFPYILDVEEEVGSQGAVIKWKTDVPANGTVEWYQNGTCSGSPIAIDDLAPSVVASVATNYTTEHRVWLGPNFMINSSFTYLYRLKSCSELGNCVHSLCSQITTASNASVHESHLLVDYASSGDPHTGELNFFVRADGNATYDNVTVDALAGVINITSNVSRNVSLMITDPTSTLDWSVEAYETSLLGINSINLSTGLNVSENTIGMNHQGFAQLMGETGASALKVTLPSKGEYLLHCDQSGERCVDISSQVVRVAAESNQTATTFWIPRGVDVFSTIMVHSTPYHAELVFSNASELNLTPLVPANATYNLTINNTANETKTWNLSAVNGTLNVSQVTIASDGSVDVMLNVTYNSSDVWSPVYDSIVVATLSTNSSVVVNSSKDIGVIMTVFDDPFADWYRTVTVCSSGCNYTTLEAAFTGINNSNSTVLITETGEYFLGSKLHYNISDYSGPPGVVSVIADNVSINCNGTRIEGHDLGTFAYVNRSENVSIHGCVIKNFSSVVRVNASTDVDVWNMSVVNANVTLSSSETWSAYHAQDSALVSFRNSSSWLHDVVLHVDNVTSFAANNMIVRNAYRYAIVEDSHAYEITWNDVENVQKGLQVNRSNYGRVVQTTIMGNSSGSQPLRTSNRSGIHLENSNFTQLSWINVSRFGTGHREINSNWTLIDHARIWSHDVGLWLSYTPKLGDYFVVGQEFSMINSSLWNMSFGLANVSYNSSIQMQGNWFGHDRSTEIIGNMTLQSSEPHICPLRSSNAFNGYLIPCAARDGSVFVVDGDVDSFEIDVPLKTRGTFVNGTNWTAMETSTLSHDGKVSTISPRFWLLNESPSMNVTNISSVESNVVLPGVGLVFNEPDYLMRHDLNVFPAYENAVDEVGKLSGFDGQEIEFLGDYYWSFGGWRLQNTSSYHHIQLDFLHDPQSARMSVGDTVQLMYHNRSYNVTLYGVWATSNNSFVQLGVNNEGISALANNSWVELGATSNNTVVGVQDISTVTNQSTIYVSEEWLRLTDTVTNDTNMYAGVSFNGTLVDDARVRIMTMQNTTHVNLTSIAVEMKGDSTGESGMVPANGTGFRTTLADPNVMISGQWDLKSVAMNRPRSWMVRLNQITSQHAQLEFTSKTGIRYILPFVHYTNSTGKEHIMGNLTNQLHIAERSSVSNYTVEPSDMLIAKDASNVSRVLVYDGRMPQGEYLYVRDYTTGKLYRAPYNDSYGVRRHASIIIDAMNITGFQYNTVNMSFDLDSDGDVDGATINPVTYSDATIDFNGRHSIPMGSNYTMYINSSDASGWKYVGHESYPIEFSSAVNRMVFDVPPDVAAFSGTINGTSASYNLSLHVFSAAQQYGVSRRGTMFDYIRRFASQTYGDLNISLPPKGQHALVYLEEYNKSSSLSLATGESIDVPYGQAQGPYVQANTTTVFDVHVKSKSRLVDLNVSVTIPGSSSVTLTLNDVWQNYSGAVDSLYRFNFVNTSKLGTYTANVNARDIGGQTSFKQFTFVVTTFVNNSIVQNVTASNDSVTMSVVDTTSGRPVTAFRVKPSAQYALPNGTEFDIHFQSANRIFKLVTPALTSENLSGNVRVSSVLVNPTEYDSSSLSVGTNSLRRFNMKYAHMLALDGLPVNHSDYKVYISFFNDTNYLDHNLTKYHVANSRSTLAKLVSNPEGVLYNGSGANDTAVHNDTTSKLVNVNLTNLNYWMFGLTYDRATDEVCGNSVDEDFDGFFDNGCFTSGDNPGESQQSVVSSGGGGGGGGAGAGFLKSLITDASQVVLQFDKAWFKVETGDVIALRQNATEVSVRKIQVEVTNTTFHAGLDTTVLQEAPEEGDVPNMLVYQYFKLDHKNLDDDNSANVVIDLAVPKDWLNTSNISQYNVALWRYNDTITRNETVTEIVEVEKEVPVTIEDVDNSTSNATGNQSNATIVPVVPKEVINETVTRQVIEYAGWQLMDTELVNETALEYHFVARPTSMSLYAVGQKYETTFFNEVVYKEILEKIQAQQAKNAALDGSAAEETAAEDDTFFDEDIYTDADDDIYANMEDELGETEAETQTPADYNPYARKDQSGSGDGGFVAILAVVVLLVGVGSFGYRHYKEHGGFDMQGLARALHIPGVGKSEIDDLVEQDDMIGADGGAGDEIDSALKKDGIGSDESSDSEKQGADATPKSTGESSEESMDSDRDESGVADEASHATEETKRYSNVKMQQQYDEALEQIRSFKQRGFDWDMINYYMTTKSQYDKKVVADAVELVRSETASEEAAQNDISGQATTEQDSMSEELVSEQVSEQVPEQVVVPQALSSYIDAQIDKGVDEADIRKALEAVGWSQELYNDYLSEAFKNR